MDQRAERHRRGGRPPEPGDGHGSATRSSQFMIISAAHSLGSHGLVGVRSTDQIVHQVAEAFRPGELLRPHEAEHQHRHPHAPEAEQPSRSRVRRAGKTFTSTR